MINTYRNDTKIVAIELTNSLFGGAPKKKVSSNVFLDYSETSYLVGYTNALLSALEYVRQSVRDGSSLDMVQGDIEIALTTTWNDLATSKVGHVFTKPITLEQVMKTTSCVEILKKGSKV